MRRWLRRIALGIVAVGTVAIVTGVLFEQWSRRQADRRFPPPGTMVAFDGGRSHLRCEGAGAPTVILEAGFGVGGSEDWSRVLPAIAQVTRVCAYDRAGILFSTPRAGPRDGARIADELRTLLQAAGEAGPYVMVGHSIGGALVRVFAGRFPGDVAGMVLVDASPPALIERLPDEAREIMLAGPNPMLVRTLAVTGVLRMIDPGLTDLWPATAREVIRSRFPVSLRGALGEGAMLLETLAQSGEVASLGDRPLVVLTAGTRMAPPGVSEATAAEVERVWTELQAALATLSSNAVHRTVAGADHYIQLVDPDAVTSAVSDVVTAARNGSVLPADER